MTTGATVKTMLSAWRGVSASFWISLIAMGPTYLWFQLNTLHEVGRSFGLSEQELNDGLKKMTTGTVNTMYNSGMSPQDVMDLVAVKPLKEYEEEIKNMYRKSLDAMYKKLKDKV